MKRVLFAFAAALSASVAAFACGDERPPAAGDGTSSSGGSFFEGGTTDASSEGSADSGRLNPERLCEPLSQEGADVEEIGEASPPPEPLGGAVQPGTYLLVRLVANQPAAESDSGDVPPPIGRTGKAGRATIRVADGAFRFTEAYGSTGSLPADTSRGVSFTSKGTNLELIDECPAPGTMRTVAYSVAGNTLTFHVDSTHSQVFQKIP